MNGMPLASVNILFRQHGIRPDINLLYDKFLAVTFRTYLQLLSLHTEILRTQTNISRIRYDGKHYVLHAYAASSALVFSLDGEQFIGLARFRFMYMWPKPGVQREQR